MYITLTHATWVKDGKPVETLVVADQIFATFFMPTNNATAVVGPGGANLIVRESEEEVMKLRAEALEKTNNNNKTLGVLNNE